MNPFPIWTCNTSPTWTCILTLTWTQIQLHQGFHFRSYLGILIGLGFLLQLGFDFNFFISRTSSFQLFDKSIFNMDYQGNPIRTRKTSSNQEIQLKLGFVLFLETAWISWRHNSFVPCPNSTHELPLESSSSHLQNHRRNYFHLSTFTQTNSSIHVER